MLPPAGLSLFTFRKNIIPLADHARVAAVDLPGLGYSEFPDSADLSPQAIADLLAEFLYSCNLAPAVLCGSGESGIYALETALRHPEAVQALVLISPGSVTRYYPLSLRIINRPRLGELLIRQLDTSIMARFLSWCYFDETLVDSYMLRQTMGPYDTAQARQGLVKMLRDYRDASIFDHLERIHQPTLLVWGENDAGHPIDMAQAFILHLPYCRLLRLPLCGYLPHEEKYREFNQAVLSFLDTLPAWGEPGEIYQQVRINFET